MVLRHRSGVSRRALKIRPGQQSSCREGSIPALPGAPSAGFDGLKPAPPNQRRRHRPVRSHHRDRRAGPHHGPDRFQRRQSAVPASVVKLFIADDLLQGEGPDATDSCRPRRWTSCCASDDGAAPDLLGPQRRNRHHPGGWSRGTDCPGTTAPQRTLGRHAGAPQASSATPCCWTAAAGCPEQAEVILGISRSRHRQEPTGIRNQFWDPGRALRRSRRRQARVGSALEQATSLRIHRRDRTRPPVRHNVSSLEPDDDAASWR